MVRRVCKAVQCSATGANVDITGFCSDSCHHMSEKEQKGKTPTVPWAPWEPKQEKHKLN